MTDTSVFNIFHFCVEDGWECATWRQVTRSQIGVLLKVPPQRRSDLI